MLQITAGLSSLTKAQREAVAAFIITFPQTIETIEDDEDAVTIPAFSVVDEQSPENAFAGPVPAAATGPVLVATGDDRLDKSGLPWDDRIHSSSRVKTADGLWRKKRGVDDATVTHVEAELKALMGLPAPPQAPVSGVTQPMQAESISVPNPPASIVPTAVPVPPAPTAVPTAVTVPTVDARQAFVNLISTASAAIGAKKLTQEQLTAAVVAAGVPSLPLLGNRLDLVPQVALTVDALIASAQ